VSDFEDTLRIVIELLDQAGIAHALIGGIAVGLHGYPRSTGDIDLLVDGSRRKDVVDRMNAAGYALAASTEEVLHFAGPVPVDMLLARREATRLMLRDATRVTSIGANVLRVEDIIGLKIQAFSNDRKRQWHDQADIAELIRANPDMEWTRVLRYAGMFDATALLEQIRRGVLD
jgi:hypothetical protein